MLEIGFPKTIPPNEVYWAVISAFPINFAAKITEFQVEGSMNRQTKLINSEFTGH